jgi:hypothetical protein
MVRRVLVFLVILLALPLYSQSLPKPDRSWPICFTELEWASLEDQVWQDEQAAILEAVGEAVQPYIAVVQRQQRQLFWWKVGTGAAIATAFASLLYAALK